MQLVTPAYRILQSDLTKVVMARWCARRWWIIALPFLALIAMAVYDVRFAVVALIYALILIPLILAFVYYSYLLKPRALQMLQPQSASFDGHILSFHPQPEENTPSFSPTPPIAINQIRNIYYARKLVVLVTGPGIDNIIAIPQNPFGPQREAEAQAWLTAMIDALNTSRNSNK